jgi:hypothetical protein
MVAKEQQKGAAASSSIAPGQNLYQPEVIILSSDALTTIPDDYIGFTVVQGEKDAYVSREGGTTQATTDNVHLKISTTFEDTEWATPIPMTAVGVYSKRLNAYADTWNAGPSFVFPANGAGRNQVWEVYNVISMYENVGLPTMDARMYERDDVGGARAETFGFARNTQTLTLNGTEALPPTNTDPFIVIYTPTADAANGANYTYTRGPILNAAVLPTPFSKTGNNILTVVWIIHFDAV